MMGMMDMVQRKRTKRRIMRHRVRMVAPKMQVLRLGICH